MVLVSPNSGLTSAGETYMDDDSHDQIYEHPRGGDTLVRIDFNIFQ
jgi:hypothetical protein